MAQENIEGDNDFIGLGWSFPIRFTGNGAHVEKVDGPEAIETAISLILSTAMAERIPRPRFGCDLHDLVYGKMNQDMDRNIRHRVEMALVQHEPRITVDDISVTANREQSGRVDVQIAYILRNTNTRYNMVYPVYLEEMSA